MAEASFSLFSWKRSELVFVATVLIAILAISFFQLRVGEMKTRDSQRRSDLDLVTRALEDYYGDHGVFPLASADGLIIACGDEVDLPCPWGGGPIRDLQGVVYLRQIPQDPFTYKGQHYVYDQSADAQYFK